MAYITYKITGAKHASILRGGSFITNTYNIAYDPTDSSQIHTKMGKQSFPIKSLGEIAVKGHKYIQQ